MSKIKDLFDPFYNSLPEKDRRSIRKDYGLLSDIDGYTSCIAESAELEVLGELFETKLPVHKKFIESGLVVYEFIFGDLKVTCSFEDVGKYWTMDFVTGNTEYSDMELKRSTSGTALRLFNNLIGICLDVLSDASIHEIRFKSENDSHKAIRDNMYSELVKSSQVKRIANVNGLSIFYIDKTVHILRSFKK